MLVEMFVVPFILFPMVRSAGAPASKVVSNVQRRISDRWLQKLTFVCFNSYWFWVDVVLEWFSRTWKPVVFSVHQGRKKALSLHVMDLLRWSELGVPSMPSQWAQWACRFAHREAAAHSGGGHTAQTTREAGSQMWQNRCGKTLWQKCHYPTVREAASPLKCDKKEPNWPERTETLSLREKNSWLWQNVSRIHLKKSWHCSEVPFLILYSLPLSGQSLSNTWAFFPCEQKLKVPLLNM